jgi:transporter family protein
MWVVYSIATAILLALSSLFAKNGSKRAHPTVVTSLRTLVVAIFAWVIFFTNGSTNSFSLLTGTGILYIALTGAAFAGAMICYHFALKKGSLIRAAAFEKLTSFVIMLVSVVVYNHTSLLYVRIICLVLLGIGIILMLSNKSKAGSGTVILYGSLFAVASTAAYILNGYIGLKNGTLALAFILTVTLVTSLISSFVCGLQGGVGKLQFGDLMMLLLSGFTAGLAWLSYSYATSYGDGQIVSVIVAMSFAASVGLASLFLKEKASWKTVCGMLLIAVGILVYEFVI